MITIVVQAPQINLTRLS